MRLPRATRQSGSGGFETGLITKSDPGRGRIRSRTRIYQLHSLQLPAQPTPDEEGRLKQSVAAEIKPQVGIMIRHLPFHKARSVKHCCQLIGHNMMCVERKYGGEYCQIHVNKDIGAVDCHCPDYHTAWVFVLHLPSSTAVAPPRLQMAADTQKGFGVNVPSGSAFFLIL